MAEIAGLKLIVPSSVAGTGVSLSGAKVIMTNATSVSINGCFSSTYDNYLIVIRYADTNSQTLTTRLRASGSDNSTASSYVAQRLRAFGSTVDGIRLTGDSWTAAGGQRSTNISGTHLYLYGPYLTQPTAFRNVMVSDQDGAYINEQAGTHNQSTAYDGITFTPGDQSVDGALTIYGLSQ